MTFSPRDANTFDAQQVFEPTSSSHCPGLRSIVPSTCCIERACVYQ
jgi:hypothetical protein